MARKLSYKSRKTHNTSRFRRGWHNNGSTVQVFRLPRVRNPFKVHYFTRTQETYYDITPNSIPNGGFFANYSVTAGTAGAFRLNQLPNYSEFTALFDQYKINGVKLTWMLSANTVNMPNVSPGNTTASLPILYTAIDRDDGTPYATFDEMNQNDTCKLRRMDRVVTRYVKPYVAVPVYSAGAFNGYAAPTKNPWIDAASPATEYYGIKWAIDPVIANSANLLFRVKLLVKFYIACRDTR